MWADGAASTVALTAGGRVMTYGDLAAAVAELAPQLAQRRGIVAVSARNEIGTAVMLCAALAANRPAALVPPGATETELSAYRRLLGRAVELDERGTVVWEQDGAVAHHPDAALIAFTSGSTGEPRAVQLSRAHLERNAANCIEMVGMREVREQMIFAPLSHLFALFGHLLPGLRAGLTTHLFSGVAEMRPVIERGSARGILSGVPSHWEALLRYCRPDPGLYAHVSRLVSSGSPLSESLRRRLADRFPNAVQLNGYGLSEAPRILSLSSRHPRFFSNATGLPTPGAELAVGDDGELRVRGALLMLGYLGAPEATAERVRDGWLHTGDAASVAEDGVYTVLGRLDDVRKIGAERISLVEIDSELLRLAGVEDAAAAVERDDVYGERLVAYVAGSDALRERSRAELRDELAQRVAWHKVPHRFLRVAALPRNRVGKLQRGLLAALEPSAEEIR